SSAEPQELVNLNKSVLERRHLGGKRTSVALDRFDDAVLVIGNEADMALPARQGFSPPYDDIAGRRRAFETCFVVPTFIFELLEQRAGSRFRREWHGAGIAGVEAEGD